MTTPDVLAGASRGCVVAAAGCGKTDLIARAVAASTGRQLVLTHTNAGVEALHRRMRRLGLSGDRVAVDTIAGWCMKYLIAYPGRSGGLPTKPDGFADWQAVYPKMKALLGESVIRKVISASYAGVFVDEYQDCDLPQHDLVCRIAEHVSVRVLGDPLQSVFRFAGDPPHWTSVVESAFPRIGTLTTPWRWKRPGHNAALGEWLSETRHTLRQQQPVDLRDSRIRYEKTKSSGNWQDETRSVCFETAKSEGTSVAILKWANGEYLVLSKLTGGLYQCVEPIDAKDAGRFLSELEKASPTTRPDRIMDFLRNIAVHFESPFDEVSAASNGMPLLAPDAPAGKAAMLLRDVRAGGTPAVAANALDALSRLPGLKVFRRELLWAAIDSLRDADMEGYNDLLRVLRHRRNLTSHIGRRFSRCTVGSTLLLKGMEFDHAIVVHTGKFSVFDLYVALTRGSKSLTVLSPTPQIDVRHLALG